MKKRDKQILSKLRKNSRTSLANIGKSLEIPQSTVFDRINKFRKQGVIKKYTVLLDHSKAGYNHLVNLILKVDPTDKDSLKGFLMNKNCVNNLYEADDSFVFIMDLIHQTTRDYVNFRENIKSKFKIRELKETVILDDLKRESFMNHKNISE